MRKGELGKGDTELIALHLQQRTWLNPTKLWSWGGSMKKSQIEKRWPGLHSLLDVHYPCEDSFCLFDQGDVPGAIQLLLIIKQYFWQLEKNECLSAEAENLVVHNSIHNITVHFVECPILWKHHSFKINFVSAHLVCFQCFSFVNCAAKIVLYMSYGTLVKRCFQEWVQKVITKCSIVLKLVGQILTLNNNFDPYTLQHLILSDFLNFPHPEVIKWYFLVS